MEWGRGGRRGEEGRRGERWVGVEAGGGGVSVGTKCSARRLPVCPFQPGDFSGERGLGPALGSGRNAIHHR